MSLLRTAYIIYSFISMYTVVLYMFRMKGGGSGPSKPPLKAASVIDKKTITY